MTPGRSAYLPHARSARGAGAVRIWGRTAGRSPDEWGHLQPTGTIDYGYYPPGCTPQPGCAPGRLATLIGPGSIGLSLGYDGPLTTGVTWAGEVNGSVTWAHDTDFRPITETVTDGTITSDVALAYNTDSLLTCASPSTCATSATDALRLNYATTLPRLTGTTLGSVTDTYAYNTFSELATYTVTHGSTQLYRVVYDSTATPRDALGRVVEKVETLQGITRTSRYEYDDLGRLIAVTEDGVLAEEYDYDDNGNRLALTTPDGTTEGTYDDQDRLLAYGDYLYTYTANGELASKTDTASGEVTTYQYDALGSLLRVDLPDGRVIEYVVDGHGRRVARKVDGVTIKRWLYRDQLNPVAELDGAGVLTWQYVYGSKPNVPDYAIRVSDGARYRIVSDQLGSVVLVVNVADAADVIFAARYSAFGGQEVIAGSAEWGAFGFAGGRYDPETGLVRFGARDYDPGTGRWTARDPIWWDGGQANLLAYVALEAVNLRDPSGLSWLDTCYKIWRVYGALSKWWTILDLLGVGHINTIESECELQGLPVNDCCVHPTNLPGGGLYLVRCSDYDRPRPGGCDPNLECCAPADDDSGGCDAHP